MSHIPLTFPSLTATNGHIRRRVKAFTRSSTRFSFECLEARRLLANDVAVIDDPSSNDSGNVVAASAASGLLDNNLKVVDLSDLIGDLPLSVDSTTQILWHSEAWEQNNPTLGFTTIVKNDRGQNPDNKYYLYYAHHDPESGIGAAVGDSVTGPYTKISPPDSQVLIPSGGSQNQHFSTPSVVWNEDAQLWHMYFHFWNSDHFPWRNTMGQGFGHQMTALATTADLSSHNWTPLPGNPDVLNPAFQPVLPSTADRWINSQSSYHGIQRLADGTWVAFMRGTGGEYDNAGQWLQDTTKIGIATSNDGINWSHLPQNPILHEGDGGGGPPGDYTPEFIGYLGDNGSGQDEYLLVWNEAGQIQYGTTTDFVNVQRDPRGHASWPSYGGADDVRREGDTLYIFTGRFVHTMALSVASSRPVVDLYAVDEDDVLSVGAQLGVLDNDVLAPGGGPFTAELVEPADNGQVVLNPDGSFVYTPSPDFFGDDSFSYRLIGDPLATTTARVTISVAPTPDPPLAIDDSFVVSEDTTFSTGVPEETVVRWGAVWKYLDTGIDQGTAWRNPAHNDSTWLSGPAELGYGDGDEATVVSFGSDAGNKFPTTYFRHSFQLSDVDRISHLVVNLKRDDGAAVYLNGVEIARDNLAPDATFGAFSDAVIADESEILSFTLTSFPSGMLVEGTNVLAAEIHQAGGTSSDISFDLELTVRRAISPGVLANDIEPDGEPVSAVLLSLPQHGIVVLESNGNFSYTPNAEFSGTDSFSYLINDLTDSDEGLVTMTVLEVNDLPVAVDDQYSVIPSQSLVIDVLSGVLDNDTDQEDDPLMAVIVTPPAHGTLMLASDGSFVYTPEAGFVGQDTFDYRPLDMPSDEPDLIPQQSDWRFLDNGSNQSTAWREVDFDDSMWSTGPGQLGYGDGDEQTVVGFGGDENNKHATTYFRHTFNVLSATRLISVDASLLRDDVAAVFVNGIEVFRDSELPAGAGYETYVETSNGDNAIATFTINPGLLVDGQNVVAVEVHQANPTSSDLSFEFSLTADLAIAAAATVALEVSSTAAGDVNLDGIVDAADIDDLFAAIGTGSSDLRYDVDGSGSIEVADVDFLIGTILDTTRGDTNLDGDVDTGDLTTAIIHFTGAGGVGLVWADGDTDGDGDIDTGDLTTAIIRFTGASAEA